jgi:hypothetical protein
MVKATKNLGAGKENIRILDFAAGRGRLSSRAPVQRPVPKCRGFCASKVPVELQEIAPGVWGRRNWPFSRTTVAAKCVPQAIVCLSSALYFHGLLSEEPPEVFLAIGEKARRPRREQPLLRIVRFSGAALSEGVEHHSDQGVPVRVYSVAKTVADLFKYRGKLGCPIAVRALRAALLAGLCTPEELLRYGAICHVRRTLEPYLEVLMTRRGADIQAAIANRRVQPAPGQVDSAGALHYTISPGMR